MPWEIDYALLTFTQLRKSKYYLPEDVNITIDSVLNLSTNLIDWEESTLPKEYFIKKYETLSTLLDVYIHHPKVYQGDDLYGHLDLQRDAISEETDYYINICPDTYFSEHLLHYLVQAARQIPNKYFVLVPEICKMWDTSWDSITHPMYKDVPHLTWSEATDVFDVDHYLHTSGDQVTVSPVEHLKWAGWFDLYNKDYYEDLARIPQEWKGYGGHDYYGMQVAHYARHIGLDFKQYKLENQIAFEYSVGPINSLCEYYREFISIKNPSAQRESFAAATPRYVEERIQQLTNLL